MKRAQMVLIVLSASIAVPSIAAVHFEKSFRVGRELIHKNEVLPSGIYNLRRQPSAPSSRGSMPRKPRVKSATESVAGID
ncbi:MAG: hypothetical protein EOP04_07830 [Proteobacteria bacterium]|nr:MAG: hypothetical protein EOP04_07830 [Pseudomonadota bacterium]